MPENEDPHFIRTDAEGLADNKTPAIVVLTIERHDIESGNIARALDLLLTLIDNQDAVMRYRESLVFEVTGYDDDPRELAEIPEVRAFFARLTQDWPHWLWFLHRKVGAIPLLLALLCRVMIHRTEVGCATEYLDQGEVANCIKDLFGRGNRLFAFYDIPTWDVDRSAGSVVAELLD